MISSSNETKNNFYCNEDYIELDSFIHDKIYFQDIQDIKLLCNNDMHIQKQGIGFLNNDFFFRRSRSRRYRQLQSILLFIK